MSTGKWLVVAAFAVAAPAVAVLLSIVATWVEQRTTNEQRETAKGVFGLLVAAVLGALAGFELVSR